MVVPIHLQKLLLRGRVNFGHRILQVVSNPIKEEKKLLPDQESNRVCFTLLLLIGSGDKIDFIMSVMRTKADYHKEVIARVTHFFFFADYIFFLVIVIISLSCQ